MITRDEIVEVGRYNKPHGIGGEISATATVPAEALTHFTCLVSEIDGIAVPFFINSWRPKTSDTVLLKIDGIDNEHEAMLLSGKAIYALKREWTEAIQEADDDELPLDSLVGFAVECNGKPLGHITAVDYSTANALLQVTTAEGDEVIVPAVEDFISEVNVERRKLTMSVPEALLKLNSK